MKVLVLTAALLLLTACADMTPTQKRWTAIGVSVVATGAIVAYQAGHGPNGPQAGAATSNNGCAFNAGAQFCAGQPRGK